MEIICDNWRNAIIIPVFIASSGSKVTLSSFICSVTSFNSCQINQIFSSKKSSNTMLRHGTLNATNNPYSGRNHYRLDILKNKIDKITTRKVCNKRIETRCLQNVCSVWLCVGSQQIKLKPVYKGCSREKYWTLLASGCYIQVNILQ